MQQGEVVKVKFSPFKKSYAYECGGNGVVLEKIGGGICFYATDHTHEEIYCVMPLGYEKDFKDRNYYISAPDEQHMMLRVRNALLVIDYKNHWVSTNVENFRVYGSPAWGQKCGVPWKDAYTRMFAAAEKKRTGGEGKPEASESEE